MITGCAIMAVGLHRPGLPDHSLLSIIVGSTVVSIGTAIAYAAMPSLIMANVPITETASANGLNALLRALGTSTASAVIAALLDRADDHGRRRDGDQPGRVRGHVLALGGRLSARLRGDLVRAAAARRTGRQRRRPRSNRAAAVRQAGESTEIVVRGRVLRPDDRPHPHAVVTAVRLSGEPLDWSRADNEGAFSLALPGRDRYLVIANADGWTPRSR